MGIFEKLKNALFEEEYIEVEEKPKKKKKQEKPKVSSVMEKYKSEKPIAKKVVLPDKKETYAEELDEDLVDSDFDVPVTDNSEYLDEEKPKDFKIMDDKDFEVEESVYKPVESVPQIVKVIEKDEYLTSEEAYRPKPVEKPKQPYGIDTSVKVSVKEYGGYDRKDDRGYFKPSPIISPIYGILDKNYRKEEIVTRKEVRLTSSYAKERLSVDDVRKKAYGSLSDDIESDIVVEKDKKVKPTFEVQEEEKEEENLLVDLTSDKEKPSVKEVTMGDALEYFQDLGLEYNVDYMDASKKATGRRVKPTYEEKEESLTSVTEEENNIISDSNDDSDDNLFDLIDSMYKDEE